MIKVIIELGLVYPYKASLLTLLEFNKLWHCRIIDGGTYKKNATIAMPVIKFKKIFKENPQAKKYKIPSNSEHFIASVEVKSLLVE